MDIREIINIIEGIESQVLNEAQHTDLFKQAYDSATKALSVLNFKELNDKIKTIHDMFFNSIKSEPLKSFQSSWKIYMAQVAIHDMYFIIVSQLDSLISKVENNTDIKNLHELFKKKLEKAKKPYGTNTPFPDALTELQHYYGVQYNKIQQLNPLTLNTSFIDELERLEQEYIEKKDELDSIVEVDTDIDLLLDFGEYAWYDLKKPFCKIEGDAMGHCGNSGSYKSTDTVLSLRQKVKVDGIQYHRPVLTFILKKGGYLGEMKGRSNNKPSQKYHKYIVELLKSKYIVGIIGGGYRPENNFSIDDLSESEIEQIVDVKGKDFIEQVDILKVIAKEYKETSEFTIDMEEELEEYISENTSYDFNITITRKGKILHLDIESEVTECDYIEYLTGDEELDIDIHNDSDHTNYLELNDEIYENVVQYILDNYSEQLADLADDMGKESGELFVKDNMNQIIDVLDISEISDAISRARQDAYESGTMALITKELQSALDGVFTEFDISSNIKIYELIDNNYLVPILPVDFEVFIRNAINIEQIDYNQYFDEPRYGFAEFDEHYFKTEALLNALIDNDVITINKED